MVLCLKGEKCTAHIVRAATYLLSTLSPIRREKITGEGGINAYHVKESFPRLSSLLYFRDSRSWRLDLTTQQYCSTTSAQMNERRKSMTTDRELMKKEAVKRMEFLHIHPAAIESFEKDNVVNASFLSALYYLTDKQKERVKQFEEESGGLVYHVIQNFYEEIGELLSFLYVSKYDEEWERDMEDLDEMTPVVYVANVTDEICSEYGCIKIKPYGGGLLRIY